MKLIATKSHKYGTRRLQAGDEYEATDMHARILVGIKKARYAPETASGEAQQSQNVAPVKPAEKVVASAPVAVAGPAVAVADLELDRLRSEAKRLGIEVDGRWGDIRLRHEIAQRTARRP